MKKTYITPETGIYEVIPEFPIQESFSESKEGASDTETPDDDDWGANERHTLWDD
ncbi:MAG: hypothetical protein J5529_00295 [Prevotella sp.]|nr:hypothetical protein [Prevotella sp.]